MVEQCGTDALAMLTLAVHQDLDGAESYLCEMENRDVDLGAALLDLAGMASTAVIRMAQLSQISPDDILRATGTVIAQHNEIHDRLRRAAQEAAESTNTATVFFVDPDGDDDDD